MLQATANNWKFTVQESPSARTGCSFREKKSGSFFSQFGSGITLIIAIIIICVLLLLYLVWILFFQNRTLHNVKNILERPDDGNLNRIIINDSSSIEGIVSRQVIYVNQLKQQNDDQRTVMRRKLLNDLLTARAPIDAKAETAQLERVGIPVENRCFIVIDFEICDLKDSVQMRRTSRNMRLCSLLQKIFCAITAIASQPG